MSRSYVTVNYPLMHGCVANEKVKYVFLLKFAAVAFLDNRQNNQLLGTLRRFACLNHLPDVN